jgi:hypothetical protein
MSAIETLISAWIAQQEHRERVLRRVEREPPERDVAPPRSGQLDQGHARQQHGHAE